ncbi:hypothetical protein [Shewanella sp. ALD9]|uniref:hypothetical protein n=1 Tax=unclassified Shewanella TaxID=196818 RepID=UPI000C34FA22|nr:hypothetical protein [Shewanella sp. ALD9]PKH30811.1 hypothetical protein CXF88_14325 [Shewanella sp. ALD9]
MGVGMSFSAKLELNEAQETELEAMTLRHEQATSFQFQLQECCGESLSYDLFEGEFSGYIKYPLSHDPSDWSDFEGIVLAWLSEVRRTFGGDDWQVYRQDVEPVAWIEASQSYYHDPL